ncbi:MAG: ADP-ribosylglycohydrolase family protein [Candidatus Hodarchaeales archaeon]|jgi:ADP-ribosylglycohydrolase
MSKIDKYHGCIIGQAVGDALGFLVEGRSHPECTKYLQNITPDLEIQSRHPFPAGQYTDDTQLARELILTLGEKQVFLEEDFAIRFANLFQSNSIVGRGIASQNAAMRLISGVSWKESAEPSPSAGNGTAMRSAPVGLFTDSLDNLKDISIRHSSITHNDPRTHAGAFIIASATRYLLGKSKFTTDDFIDHLAKGCESIHLGFSNEILNLKIWVELDPNTAVKIISKSGSPDFNDRWNYISPFVIPSVLWSLYSFLKFPNDYVKSIKLSIWCGGDVDTTAAMTGALGGVFLGIQSIPNLWINQIQDQGNWKADKLKEIVKKLIK